MSYDAKLLAEAPAVTKAAKQEGYNVDILEQPPAIRSAPSPSSRESSLPLPVSTSPIPSSGHGLAKGGVMPVKPKWWQTARGRIILVILAFVVVAAVVGGAVGATVGKNKDTQKGEDQGGSLGDGGAPTITDGNDQTKTSQQIAETGTRTSTEIKPSTTPGDTGNSGQPEDPNFPDLQPSSIPTFAAAFGSDESKNSEGSFRRRRPAFRFARGV